MMRAKEEEEEDKLNMAKTPMGQGESSPTGRSIYAILGYARLS
jgi:hypothetical protein